MEKNKRPNLGGAKIKRKRKLSQTAKILAEFQKFLEDFYSSKGMIDAEDRRDRIAGHKRFVWYFIEVFLKKNGWVVVKESYETSHQPEECSK